MTDHTYTITKAPNGTYELTCDGTAVKSGMNFPEAVAALEETMYEGDRDDNS